VVASDLRARDDVFAADVTDGEAMRAVVAQAVATHGRLDLAANCAGVGGGHGATHEYPEAEFDRIVAINLRGTWLSMRAELEAMLRTGGGAIVNVSSTLGLRGSPFAAPYSASKHGVLGLTKTAALEYAQLEAAVDRAAMTGGEARELALAPDELRTRDPLGQLPRPSTRRVYAALVYVRWKSSSQVEPSVHFSKRPLIVLPPSANSPTKRCAKSGSSRESSHRSGLRAIA
jgi:NAD(P)-dependent dehydrogenase (short-subunit alcohol dehydrogenase family)